VSPEGGYGETMARANERYVMRLPDAAAKPVLRLLSRVARNQISTGGSRRDRVDAARDASATRVGTRHRLREELSGSYLKKRAPIARSANGAGRPRQRYRE